MTRALLDINVLLALFDRDHIDHGRARHWLEQEIPSGWATCPITQNGFVRVISQPRYPSPISPTEAMELLSEACVQPAHEFWPCDLSVLDTDLLNRTRVHGPRQVTDAYLVGLAKSHGARLATFDRGLALTAPDAVHLIQ